MILMTGSRDMHVTVHLADETRACGVLHQTAAPGVDLVYPLTGAFRRSRPVWFESSWLKRERCRQSAEAKRAKMPFTGPTTRVYKSASLGAIPCGSA